ncbi:hypothetical protein ACW7EJ_00645 [Acinetobacter soli]
MYSPISYDILKRSELSSVLTAKKLQGSYQKVTLNGQEITPIYQDNSLRFKIS